MKRNIPVSVFIALCLLAFSSFTSCRSQANGYSIKMNLTGCSIKELQLRLWHTSASSDSINKINGALRILKEEMETRAEKLKREFPGSMLALFAQLIREPRIPEPVIPPSVTNREQFRQNYLFNYMSAHFFDPVDFSDPGIVFLPVYEEKLRFYFQQLVPPFPDSLMTKVGKVVEKARSNAEVYNYTVKFLYRMFRESSIPEYLQVSGFIGENYILIDSARWKDPAFVEKVRERTLKARLNPVGSIATDLKLQKNTGETLRLSEVKAPLTILYFFNPDCDACLPVTEQLFPLWLKYKNRGIRVFAVYLDRKTETWKKYIASKGLDWLNVYDPEGSERIESKYDIYAIPMIYLLDREKKILAKDVPVEKLEEMLKQLILSLK